MTTPDRRSDVPGTTLLKIARLLCDERLLSTVVQPTIADLQREITAASGNAHQRRRARWRGYAAFWKVTLLGPLLALSSPSGNVTGLAVPPVMTRLAAVSIGVAFLAVADAWLRAWVVGVTVVGAMCGYLLHAWYDRHPSEIPTPREPRWRSPQINFSSTEVAGNIGGLIFVVGSIFVVVIGVPSVIWFLFGATLAGCLLAWALLTWHTSHPRHGTPENRIVLR